MSYTCFHPSKRIRYLPRYSCIVTNITTQQAYRNNKDIVSKRHVCSNIQAKGLPTYRPIGCEAYQCMLVATAGGFLTPIKPIHYISLSTTALHQADVYLTSQLELSTVKQSVGLFSQPPVAPLKRVNFKTIDHKVARGVQNHSLDKF